MRFDEELEEDGILTWSEDKSLEKEGSGKGFYMPSCPCAQQCLAGQSIATVWKLSYHSCQGFESDVEDDEGEQGHERMAQITEFVRRLEVVGRDLHV